MPETFPARVDAFDKVTGRARYIEDLPDLPGTAYAATIRSPYSHAQILSIDTAAAEALPGFAGVIHGQDLAGVDVHLQPGSIHQQFLATDHARFDGDLIGLIAADDLRTARAAAGAVEVEYDLLPPIFSFVEATAPGAQPLHDGVPDNIAIADDLAWGDVEEGFRQAAQVFEGTYWSPAVFHHPIEPCTSFVVRWSEGTLEVWAPANRPNRLQEELAEWFELPEARIRVHVPYIGGSFGAKDLFSSEVQVAAALSRKIGRPITFIATEEESFRATARHAVTYKARLGVSLDGSLTALDADLELDTGAYFTGAASVNRNALTSAMGAYRVPNVRVRARSAYTNKVPAATFRSTGRSQTTYGLECLIDTAAASLGIDPIAFRERNLLSRGEQLAPPTWIRKGKQGPSTMPAVDTDFDELLRRAAAGIDWHAPLPAGHGRGIAVSFRRSSESGEAAALATLQPDGTIAISHNAPDLGGGAHTAIMMIAARTLSVPAETIRVGEPDTANGLYFTGANSQRTTVQMGAAVHTACNLLREQILTAAARLDESSLSDWQLASGTLSSPPRSHKTTMRVTPAEEEPTTLTLQQLAGQLPAGRVLQARGEFRADSGGDNPFRGHDHWTPGAAAAEVEVDRDTGEVHLIRYCAVGDAGQAIHYPSARGQLEGGAVLGMGLALFEEMLYQEGQLQNGDPFQYRLPLMRDMPSSFATSIVENEDGPGPFGSKAMAQTSLPCVTPAICNAIANATGVRLREAPFTPERILRALGALA